MIPGYDGCLRCPLRDRPSTRPSGPANAAVMIIGEAPGQTEAKNGIPFVGPSGKLLRASLRSVGVDPDFVYITNTVACHPEENATPTAEAIACCHDRLVAEIEHVQPKKILLLGSTALSLLGPKQSVSRTRGLGHMYNGAFTIATYHPAAILRNPDLFRDFSHDLQKLVSRTRPQERLIPEYLIVEDKVQGSNLLDLMRSASVISCDLETTGTDSLHDKIIAIGFGISVESYGEIGIIFPKEMVEVMKWSILTFLSNFEGKIVFHNIKFDMSFIRVWAEKIDFKLKHPVDSMLMVYAQDERGIPQEQKGQAYFTAGLKDQSRLRYDIPDYHWDFDEFYALPEDVRNWGQFYAYLAMDVICTLKLYWDLSAELDGESERLMPLVENLLTPGALAFSQIELRGFPIDRAYLEVLKVETEQQALAMVEELKVMAREASGGVINDFLPSSPKQVREMAKVWKFNPPSFEKDVLQVEIELGKWPDECKTFFSKLLEYRQISKVLQTYIVGILTRLGEDDRIHPDFQMHGTDTGRLSCIAQGTMIEIVRDVSKFPRGIPIEDVKVGDLAYSYTDDGDLVIRPVTATLYQGTKKVCRVHWRSSYGREGFVDLTPDHKVRLSSNEWRRSDELRPGDSLLSMGRSEDYLFPTGGEIFLDHRFVASQVVGDVTGKVVHHRDGNHYNNVPSNLEILSDSAHKSYHARLAQDEGRSAYRSRPLESHPRWLNLSRETIRMSLEASGWSVLGAAIALGYDFNSFKGHVIRAGFDLEELKKKNREGRRDQILASAKNARDAYSRQARERNNHKVVRVEILEGEVPVYDLTIDDTWKMVANEICIANCRNPNLQNIPTIMGPKIKHAFIAPEGWKLFNCDYSQLELRVAAWFSRDDALMEAFRTGRDIHRWVASLMFKKPMDQITSFERYLAKYLDFGLLYGRSARGLLEGMEATYIIKTTGKAMTEKEADALQKDFFDAFPGLVKYINNQHRFVNANLFVESPTGRRRRFPFVDNRSRGSMERKSVNTPIQSFASDCTLTAIIRLVEILDPSYAYVVSSVHDSIMLLVRDDYVDAVKEVVHQVMSTPPIAGFDVPLKAEIAVGQRWSQMKD